MVHTSKSAIRTAEQGAAVIAAMLAAAGTLVLVAWLGGARPLATFGLGDRTIRPAVALCLVLFGAALRWRHRRGARLALGATIAAIVTGGVATAAMASSAALALASAAAALPLLAHPGRRAGAACTTLLLVTGLVGLASLVARLYGVAPGSSGANVLMALPTTFATLLLSIGGQLARPTRGLVGLALRDDAAGFLVGRLLPTAIVVPIALGYLRLLGQRAGLFGIELGLALFATSNVVVFASLVALAARVVVRHDHWRAILDGTSYAIVATAPDGTVRETNRAAERLLGVGRGHLLGRKLPGLVASGDHELVLPRRDGSVVPIELSLTALRDGDGDRAGYVGVARDVTALRRAAEEVRQLREALEHAVEGIARLDAEGRYVTANAAYAAAVGRAPEELAGQPWDTTVAPADRERLAAAYERMLVDGKVEAEALGLRADGSTFFKRVVMIASRNADGSLLGHYCFSKDISVEHEAHEELVRAKEAAEAGMRARSDFLARMSHEIRTPMNGVMGMTRLALETELAPEQREYLETVESSARGLLEIIDDVLDFAKIDAQRLHLEQTPFALRECLGIAVRGLAQRAHGKALELLVDVAADVPDRVVGDPLRLAQIVVNLVGNAVKFTPFGEIVVSARVRERDAGAVLLELAVRDTGIGIPADKQRRVFEAFRQADEATTRKYGGTGLGLAISTQLVHMMGGEIGVDSAPERGSTFWFTTRLPLAPPVETMTEDTLPSLRDLPVLIVDDHAHSRRILVEQLAGWGVLADGVTSAAAPAALRRAAEGGRPHELMILDATAAFSGDEIAAPPTIVLTRAAGGREPRRAAAHLLKPPTPQALRDTLREVLAGRAARRGAPLPERPARRPLAILIAEDNPINAKLASVVLKKGGHEVVVVDSGAAALAALAARAFDVVLMDVQMPEMDGLETTRAIRAREAVGGDRRVTIIALTAQAMKGDRERCLAAGMDGYVAKPFDAETLFAELDARVPPVERAAPAAAAPAVAPIAHDELVHRAGGDLELVRDIAALFADDAPKSVAALRDAVAGGDPAAIARAAHKLKGALLNVAARPAAQAALALEEAGRRGEVDGAGAALVRLEAEVHAVIAALAAVAHTAPRAA